MYVCSLLLRFYFLCFTRSCALTSVSFSVLMSCFFYRLTVYFQSCLSVSSVSPVFLLTCPACCSCFSSFDPLQLLYNVCVLFFFRTDNHKSLFIKKNNWQTIEPQRSLLSNRLSQLFSAFPCLSRRLSSLRSPCWKGVSFLTLHSGNLVAADKIPRSSGGAHLNTRCFARRV